MESSNCNMVDAGIDLETGDLGHLAFPLDADGSATTDGNLLSSLTSDTITDDMSAAAVLTVLPHSDSAFPRGMTPVSQLQYGTPHIVSDSLPATTSYELTELEIASGIDVSSKLVSDSSDILLAGGAPVQPTIALATWSPDTVPETPVQFTQDSSLLSDLKTFSQNQTPVPAINTLYLTTVKSTNNYVHTNEINTLNNKQQITGANGNIVLQNTQIYNQGMLRNSHNVSLRPLQLENIQSQNTVVTVPQSVPVLPSAPAFTVRFPLPATIGKGVQLHLVAKGQGELPVNGALQNHVTQTNNVIHQNQANTGTGIMLFRDKSTGKSYIIPTGPASMIVNPTSTLHIAQQQQVPQHQSSTNLNTECPSPEIDVLGNSNDPYGDLGIAEPQPVIDVNEFLNIPPKDIQTENVVTNEVQTVQDVNIINNNNQVINESELTNVENNIKMDASKNEIIIVSPYFNVQNKLEDVTVQKSSTQILDQTGENYKQNTLATETEQDISAAATGEDLIKMMAVKKSSRKIEVENEEEHSQASNNDSIENLETDDEHSKDVSFDESELDISIHSEEGEMDSSIVETEQRIASIVPDSMKDFVRDIFEDEDALDKEYIQEIMDDTGPSERNTESSALSPGDIAKHAVQKLADKVNELKGMDVKAKIEPTVSVQVDKSQMITVDGQKRWKCNICPKMYSTKHNLVTHILSHCDIKPHCCVICGKYFKQPSHLHTHMLSHRQIRDYVCKVCGRRFTQSSHLKRHSATHMEKRPHVCDICSRGFAYPSELRAHKERHVNGQVQDLECQKCGNVFDTAKKLKLHEAKHKNAEELTCKDCGKVFVYPSQLRDHVMKHNGTRPFICKECGMDFMKEHHLKAHQFTHTGEKPFSCPKCQRTFNQKANLQRHVLIHEEKKRYKCDKCNREFSQAQVLKSHMATHENTKPFKCEECGKTFSRQHNLTGHMALHQGNKKYVCFCGAAFTLKGNLNRHKKGKHNLGPTDEEPVEQMAAETAAKILNMMSTKRLTPNDTVTQLNNKPKTGETSAPVVTSYVFISTAGNNQLIGQKLKSAGTPVKRLLPKEQVPEVSSQNEEESPLPKKKRKSVPSKLVSKEGKVIDVNENEEDSRISNGTVAENSEKIITPVKRKQLKPKCLPFNNNDDIVSEEKQSGKVKAVPSSTRRKQKAVAKANVLEPVEVQDEAEQEWQGDSRSGMEVLTEQISLEADNNENNKNSIDSQKENVSVETYASQSKVISIDKMTSFSNLSAVIGKCNNIIKVVDSTDQIV